MDQSQALLVPRTLSQIQSLDDGATGGKWIVQFPSIQDLTPCVQYLATNGELSDNTFKTITNRPIMMRCLSVNFATNSIDTDDIEMMGRKITLPKGCSAGKVSMTFLESKNYDCFNYFNNWMRGIYNPDTGFFGLPFGENGFCKDLTITVFDCSGSTVAVGKMFSCFPTSIGDLDFKERDELVEVKVEMSVQNSRWERNVIPSTSSVVSSANSATRTVNSVMNYF